MKQKKHLFLGFILFIVIIIIYLLIYMFNNTSNIEFIGNFSGDEVQKITNNLNENEPTRTLFKQGGSIKIEKKKLEDCDSEDCVYFNVKYYTNKYGDNVPAGLILNEQGEYEVKIYL